LENFGSDETCFLSHPPLHQLPMIIVIAKNRERITSKCEQQQQRDNSLKPGSNSVEYIIHN
jgi:hypothetical protein